MDAENSSASHFAECNDQLQIPWPQFSSALYHKESFATVPKGCKMPPLSIAMYYTHFAQV